MNALRPDTRRRGRSGRQRAATVARIAVSVVALALLVRRLDVRDLPRALEAVGLGPFAAAFAGYLASQVTSALRWRLISRSGGLDLGARTAVRYYFIGMFFNTFGPSTLGGDVARTLYLKARGSVVVAATTVLFDRMIGFVWLAIIVATALACTKSLVLPPALWWGAVLLAAALVVIGSVWVASARRIRPRSGGTLVSLQLLCHDRAMLVRASILSVVVQSVQIGVAVLLASAVVPSVHWSAFFVVQPLVAMLGALPISVAGLGIRESGYVYFLSTLAGAPVDRSAAFALAWLAILLAASLSGALVFLVTGDDPRTRAP